MNDLDAVGQSIAVKDIAAGQLGGCCARSGKPDAGAHAGVDVLEIDRAVGVVGEGDRGTT
jgi:hypothetical protein